MSIGQRPEGNSIPIAQQGFEFSPELLQCLAHCSGIRGVAISCVGVMGPTALLIPATFLDVTKLLLNNLYEDVACLFKFLSGFPVLQMLDLYVQFYGSDENFEDEEEGNEHDGSLASISPHIRIFQLSANSFQPLCHWLTTFQSQVFENRIPVPPGPAVCWPANRDGWHS